MSRGLKRRGKRNQIQSEKPNEHDREEDGEHGTAATVADQIPDLLQGLKTETGVESRNATGVFRLQGGDQS